MLYGVPYDLFWHLNPTKLKPFKVAYQKRLEMEEYARWRNGLYIMRAVGACFGSEYPEQPLGMEQEKDGYLDDTEDDEEENYTEEAIMRAREAFVVSLSIMEGRNQRAKAREERQRLREQQQESDSE